MNEKKNWKKNGGGNKMLKKKLRKKPNWQPVDGNLATTTQNKCVRANGSKSQL